MIVSGLRQIAPRTAHDHEKPRGVGRLEHDGAAGYYAAEGLDGGGVVLAGRVEAEPLHRGRGAAWVERAAHQVVEGVGRLDDAAAQRGPRTLIRLREAGPAVGRVVGVTVGLVLPAHDLG